MSGLGRLAARVREIGGQGQVEGRAKVRVMVRVTQSGDHSQVDT